MAPIPFAGPIVAIALELAPPPKQWAGPGCVAMPISPPDEQDGPDPAFPQVAAVVTPGPALLQTGRRYDASEDVAGFIARQNARKANAAAHFFAHFAPR